MARTLVVYYSLTGMTRKVAEEMARVSGATLAEIRDVKPRKGGWGNFRSALEAFFGWQPAIDYRGPDPSAYDLVMIGAPVWVGHVASPVNTFLHRFGHKMPKAGFFVTFGGSGAEGAILRASKLLAAPPEPILMIKDTEITGGTFVTHVRGFTQPVEETPVAVCCR